MKRRAHRNTAPTEKQEMIRNKQMSGVEYMKWERDVTARSERERMKEWKRKKNE